VTADKGAVVIALVGDDAGAGKLRCAAKVLHFVGARTLPVFFKATIDQQTRS
jgi:hypothetical protein